MEIKKEKPARGSTSSPDHIMISINGDAATSMAVTWRTSTDVGAGYVEYHEDGGEIYRADAEQGVFESDIDTSHMFWCTLKGLKPDTKYYYTCGSDAHRSETFSFTTAPEHLTKFKFACVADQQKGEPHHCPDYSRFNSFLKQVLEEHPDTRFILTGGDNTDCGQHEVQWNGLFASGYAGVVESVPLMMALGNHDDRGFADYEKGTGKYYSDPAEFFSNQFRGSYADNGPEGWKTASYAFDYGNVHFNILGLSGQEFVRDWVIEDLKGCKQTWKLGTYHFPICYSGTDCQNYEAYPLMREAFELFDLVFSGHEHNFSRSFPLKNEELFDRPSQGTIHYMLGNSHYNPPGSRTLQKVWHAAFHPQEEQVCCVCIVEVDGDKMTLTSVFNDGRIIDQCTIDKSTDTILPYVQPPIYNRTRMKFKGMDLGLCQVDTPCVEKDGVWYAPLAVLIGCVGGLVEKKPGRVSLEIYGKSAVFTEGSDTAQTNQGEVKLSASVFRGAREQLYIPCDACAVFGMRWNYAPRNNFISFEVETQAHPVTEQP
ncbi:MAG: metallophosphoesterase family protein [Oscillospiraceae bacterium]|jgi:hypothetical protein|nr:metallophosphoesterase family protein [Oscillospiraceae bacterium]